MHKNYLLVLFTFLVSIIFADGALASHAVPWQIGLQDAASPTMEKFTAFHNFITIIVTVIAIFTTIILMYTCYKFSAKRNKIPSNTTHNTLLEIIWTVIPVLIVLVIIFPSIKIINFMEKSPETELTLKVVGYQWYWGYEYPDQEGITFESRMKQDNELNEGDLRLLAVDNHIVLPVDTNIKILVTAADVIHSFTMPALGIKTDAIPGRVNETWVRINKTGVYHGQCSEICGAYHGFMPIVIEAVSKEDFQKWAKEAKKKLS